MQNIKFTELLVALTSAEYKRFGEFIQSPFYNKNGKIILLYELIGKGFSDLKYNELTREIIGKHIFPGQNQNDARVRSTLSDFKKLLEKFLIINEYENNIPVKNINKLLYELSSRNLKKIFDSTSNEAKKYFREEFNRNSDFYHDLIVYNQISSQQKGKNIEVNLDKYFLEQSDTIDNYFFLTKLELINSMLSRKYHVLGIDKLKVKFADDIIRHIERNIREIKLNHPVIYSEYLIFKMMTSGSNEKYFNSLLKFVIKNINKYNLTELEQVYYPLINFGFNKVAMGENKYLKNIFELYSKFEKKGFYSDKKFIQDIDFISIIVIGLRLKKTLWVEKFFDQHKGKIIPEFKSDTENLARALISYYRKDYNTAIVYLNRVNYNNSYYYLKSKELLMQIYYEQHEYEALQSLIDATKHYIRRRQNVLSIHYDRYVNYLKFINLLLKARQKDRNEIVLLINELKKHKNTISREWFFEKIKEIQS